MSFQLDKRLQQDCIHLTDLTLCRVLLMNDARYPWFILVPTVDSLRELMELSDEQAGEYWRESNLLQRFLKDHLKAEKINVAALGNMVPQLHIHHIARFQSDDAWPAPVWGKLPAISYEENAVAELKEQFLRYIGENQQ